MTTVAAVTVLLAACSSDGGTTTVDDGNPGVAEVVVGPDGAPTPSAVFPVDRELPFAAYADAVALVTSDDGGADEEQFVAIQELVAACMKAEGWEYVPLEYTPPPQQAASWTAGSVTLPVLPDDRADAETFGYGTDDVEALEAARTAAEVVDDNNVYLAGLEPPAQEAYLESMGGVSESDVGCQGEAVREVLGGEQLPSDLSQTYSELVNDMRRLMTYGVEQDPRGIALVDEWAQCMADAGHDVVKPSDDAETGWPAGPMQAYDLAIGTAADGTTNDAYRDMATEEIPLDSRYLVGSDAEHAIAVADFDCRASTDYVDRYLDVLGDLEADFVADRKATFDELEAAAATR